MQNKNISFLCYIFDSVLIRTNFNTFLSHKNIFLPEYIEQNCHILTTTPRGQSVYKLRKDFIKFLLKMYTETTPHRYSMIELAIATKAPLDTSDAIVWIKVTLILLFELMDCQF